MVTLFWKITVELKKVSVACMSGKIVKNLNENISYFDKVLMTGKSFDIMFRGFLFGDKRACIYYVNGFVGNESFQKLMEFFAKIKPEDIANDVKGVINKNIPYNSVEESSDVDNLVTSILSGVVVMMVDGYEQAFKIDLRSYPARSVSEPEKDKVMRGSKDGFVETIISNTALIRRRIRSPELIMKIMQAGESSKTDIVVCYMDGRVNKELLKRIIEKIENLKVDSLTMNHESLAECLYTRKWVNPFPKFKYSERPDTAAACLFEGNIVVLIDNSPQAMIIPSSLFDIIEEADDYYFPPVTGTYLRLTRLLINLISLILTPLFLLLMQHQEWIPEGYKFIIIKDVMNIPLIWQFLILEFAIDGLRLAAISTPNMLTTPLSVIAGLIIGDFAVGSGWFNSEAMLYMAFVAIANYTQSSIELGYALKFMRLITLILTAIFGVWGFFGGIILAIGCIVFNKTFAGTSYIYPIIPFNAKRLLRRFFRVSLPKSENQ